jgi:outer membrane protein W
MVTRISLLLLLVATTAFGQRKPRPELTGEDIVRKGLLRAQGTISPGWTIGDGNTNMYLQGDMEYMLQNKVSLKGDVSYFIGSVGSKLLKHNHSLFFGAQYHMPYKRFDPYIGLHPGVSVIQMRNPNLGTPEIDVAVAESNLKVSPAVSVSTGFNFYVWRYIHFMANLKYVHAIHATEWGTNYGLDEIRISFGLGWNVNLLKRK